jgi:uncharacterized membrane protein
VSALDPQLHPPWEFRSHDLSRVFALSDGIFAFSMTLLVLSLVLPVGTHGAAVRSYLLSSTFLDSLYAYVITFFVIYAWWRAHNVVFTYIRAFDRPLMQLNVVFLLFIAILPFAMDALNASGSSPAGVVFFALVEVATGVALGSLWTHAWRGGHLTAPGLPKSWERYITLTNFSVPAIFAASAGLAFVNTSYAEYLWAAIFIVPLLARRGAHV